MDAMRSPLFGASTKQTDDACNTELLGLGLEQRSDFPNQAPLAQGPCVTGQIPFRLDRAVLEASHNHTTLRMAGGQGLLSAAHTCTPTQRAMIVTARTPDETPHQSKLQTART